MNPLAAAAIARPGVAFRVAPDSERDADEVVLHGGGEVLRLPLTAEAVHRHALLVAAMPALAARLPVAVPRPRYVGVLADGSTPFLAEPRLPGSPLTSLPIGLALGQLAGVLAALREVPAKEAQQWGAQGPAGVDAVLLHGGLRPATLLADPRRGLLTGIVGWRPRIGPAADDVEWLGADPLG